MLAVRLSAAAPPDGADINFGGSKNAKWEHFKIALVTAHGSASLRLDTVTNHLSCPTVTRMLPLTDLCDVTSAYSQQRPFSLRLTRNRSQQILIDFKTAEIRHQWKRYLDQYLIKTGQSPRHSRRLRASLPPLPSEVSDTVLGNGEVIRRTIQLPLNARGSDDDDGDGDDDEDSVIYESIDNYLEPSHSPPVPKKSLELVLESLCEDINRLIIEIQRLDENQMHPTPSQDMSQDVSGDLSGLGILIDLRDDVDIHHDSIPIPKQPAPAPPCPVTSAANTDYLQPLTPPSQQLYEPIYARINKKRATPNTNTISSNINQTSIQAYNSLIDRGP